VDLSNGIWPANGINSENVAMTATETLTSNPRVLAADPLVVYKKAETRRQKDVPGGIGEEDLVVLVLPYIRSAREGVLRLGSLLEQYGTYEMNGIAFNDKDECWWLESIGGHHWIARRVKDDEVVIMPNQFGMDHFDFDDAYGEGKENLCSADLREFVEKNHLYIGRDGVFNPRLAFGSHSDSDHVYNTPRAWFMARYFLPTTYKWDGDNADFTPESDNIPWSFVPEKLVTVEDVKYILSSHYQGTPYDPYSAQNSPKKAIYRSIGINRTDVMAILQIRGYMPEPLQGVEWICFASNAFNQVLPVYSNVDDMPEFLSRVGTDVSTANFYWCSRLIAALADPIYGSVIQNIERYQGTLITYGRTILEEYDKKMTESGDFTLCAEANKKLCDMARKETVSALGTVLKVSSQHMKNGYNRADN